MKRAHLRVLVVVGFVVGVVVAGLVGAVVFDDGESVQFEDVTVQAPDGMAVTIEGQNERDGESMFPDSETVQIISTDGNISVRASGDAAVKIDNDEITGDWTRATGITAGPTWIELDPEDKQPIEIRGDVDAFEFRAGIAVDDGATDFAYEGVSGGTTQVRLSDLVADTRVVAVDAATGDYLDHATTDSAGTLELALPNSEHEVELVTVDGVAPQFEDASPGDGEVVPTTPDELAVTVTDDDFPSDEVDVTISLNGEEIHSETITEETRVTADVSQELALGEHQWSVEATDAYGNTNSETYDFSLPTNVTVRNEQNASQIITDANVTATFFSSAGDIVVEREDDSGDGNISMEGLPDTDFVVTVDADEHYERRAYVESIGDQQNIYLLNQTQVPAEEVTDTLFTYEDRTQRFAQADTTLRIQRAVDIDGDGEFEWQTVAGDFWGAAGEFPFIGETNARYRLVIKNQATGDQRVLGTHIPTADGVKNIIVGQIAFEAEDGTGSWFDAQLNESVGNLQIQYTDPANSTEDLSILVYERGNESNWILNETVDGPIGTEVWELILDDEQREESWVVRFTDSEGRVVGQLIVGGGGFPLPVDQGILEAFAITFVVFIASLYGPRTALMGAWAVVGLSGILLMFGWLNVPVAGLTVAAAIAAGATFYREAVPG